MKFIPLSQGLCAVVSDCDFERASKFKWCAAKNSVGGFYALRHTPRDGEGRQKTIYLHREVMRTPPGKLTDHRDHDGLNCQRENLRICNNSQNAANRIGCDLTSQSGSRGVMWFAPKNKWRAKIRVNGKGIHLGYFNFKKSAVDAYAAANKKYFGEFGGRP